MKELVKINRICMIFKLQTKIISVRWGLVIKSQLKIAIMYSVLVCDLPVLYSNTIQRLSLCFTGEKILYDARWLIVQARIDFLPHKYLADDYIHLCNRMRYITCACKHSATDN